jgi:Skp family chaperone for outer membrane proteins
MQKTKDKNASEQQERTALDAEQKQKVAEIKDMEKARDESKVFTKGTPEWREATNKILEKSIQLQTWGELKKAELARRHKEEIKALFDEILSAIKQVALDKKIDLVVADTSAEIPADLDTLTPEQLHALIRQQNVLFANKGTDISDEVVLRLDRDYKSNKK